MAAPAPSFVDGFAGAVGNTPLIRIKSLSDATGCTILGKAEFLNPGGCNKDRVAKQMVEEAEAVRAGAVSILLRIVCVCVRLHRSFCARLAALNRERICSQFRPGSCARAAQSWRAPRAAPASASP